MPGISTLRHRIKASYWLGDHAIRLTRRGAPSASLSRRGRLAGHGRRFRLEPLEGRTLLTNLIVTGTGDTIADDGVMTLREAITAANSMPGKDTVSFSTPTDDPRHLYYLDDGAAGRVSRFDANSASLLATTTVADDANLPKTGSLAVDPDWMHSFYSIQLSSSLPEITDAVVIDGYTQTGSSANSNPIALPANTVLRVELTSVARNDFDGLDITGGGSTIRGMAIHGFGFHAANGILLASGGDTVEGSHIGVDVS